MADGVAAAHGCTATVEISQGYPVTVNDAGFAEFVSRGGGPMRSATDARVEMPSPVMGAEDFSYVLQQGARGPWCSSVCALRSTPTRSAAPACHSNRMMLHEDVMADGIALHAAVATTFLERGGDHQSRA